MPAAAERQMAMKNKEPDRSIALKFGSLFFFRHTEPVRPDGFGTGYLLPEGSYGSSASDLHASSAMSFSQKGIFLSPMS